MCSLSAAAAAAVPALRCRQQQFLVPSGDPGRAILLTGTPSLSRYCAVPSVFRFPASGASVQRLLQYFFEQALTACKNPCLPLFNLVYPFSPVFFASLSPCIASLCPCSLPPFPLVSPSFALVFCLPFPLYRLPLPLLFASLSPCVASLCPCFLPPFPLVSPPFALVSPPFTLVFCLPFPLYRLPLPLFFASLSPCIASLCPCVRLPYPCFLPSLSPCYRLPCPCMRLPFPLYCIMQAFRPVQSARLTLVRICPSFPCSPAAFIAPHSLTSSLLHQSLLQSRRRRMLNFPSPFPTGCLPQAGPTGQEQV